MNKNNNNSLRDLIELFLLLNKRRKWQFFSIVFISIGGAISEVLSIGAVIPLLASILNPDKLFTYQSAQYISRIFNIHDSTQFSQIAALAFCYCVLVAFVIRIILLWAVGRFTFSLGAEFSTKMFSLSLSRPYSSQITINSSEKISTILVKSDALIYYAISPALTIITNSILLIGIAVLFYQIQPKISIVLIGILSTLIAGLLVVVRMKLSGYSVITSTNTKKILQVLQESFGGIRDIIIDGTRLYFITSFKSSNQALRNAQQCITFVSQCPRYVIEFIAMIGIGYSIWALSEEPEKLIGLAPIIGGFVLGFQKIFPLAMQLYSSVATIKGGSSSVSDALAILKLNSTAEDTKLVEKLHFQQQIELSEIYFKYPNSNEYALQNISFKIKKGSRVGIIGASGSGKSTLVDLIMGLIDPGKGLIRVDGQQLSSHNIRSWQSKIAHVPQSIFLADVSVAENIAFGVEAKDIDMDRVIQSAKTAKISQFIENLQDGYKTKFGERGVLISGGQRQRIGIARALYKNAQMIIMDEATSALDGETEANVIRDILNLSESLTILIISHRESSLEGCEKIIKISEGRLL